MLGQSEEKGDILKKRERERESRRGREGKRERE